MEDRDADVDVAADTLTYSILLHATCVSFSGNADKTLGVLLSGPSGAGKSDLALRLIDQGAVLVSDDQTRVSLRDGRLWAAPPETLAGRMEVRGLGIVEVPYQERALLGACFDLVEAAKIERLPEPETRRFLGISLPSLQLYPFEVSATVKLRLAVREMSGFIMDQD
ncbi:HPr kinase/phosphorylase [Pelagibius sp. Alg239-R121]|uniref:HPr kinase/phosphorylase n=1 Tax=Pelagibius sp. Alg239-R121 TaxID=2993448 RepID=UPI0024A61593|nr:HPr kinase/phosphatase C-terminal domain-containing protein [Pelagibius sp. Alg239-R121]